MYTPNDLTTLLLGFAWICLAPNWKVGWCSCPHVEDHCLVGHLHAKGVDVLLNHPQGLLHTLLGQHQGHII